MNKGWITLDRKIKNHWLWLDKREFSKLEAWIDILLTVNHTEKKVMIKNTLFLVKRGESINSLDTWSSRWNWNKSKVRRFLILLQNDNMIVTKSEKKTTRLTVCKYEGYQGLRNASETLVKHKRNASETEVTPNNNDNNINNSNNEEKEKPFNFRKSILSLGAKENLLDDWLKVRKSKRGVNTETAFKGFEKQLKLSGLDINAVLEMCVTKNWVGFDSDWVVKKTKTPRQGNSLITL